MAEIWFTADNHFGHANIIDHCERPWVTSHIMDDAMTEIWNQYVKPQDTVYILGDFIHDINWDAALVFAKKLHGNKVILKGNHDHWYKKEKRYFHHKRIDKIHCWMCHYPLMRWPAGINLHGHCHGNLEDPLPNQFDVGVDTNPEYRPYHWEEIKAKINTDYLDRFTRDRRID